MRQIKFRGKTPYGGHWIIGDLKHCGNDNISITPFISMTKGRYVDPLTVGQFTGLQYKGVDLYGGMKFKYSFDDYVYDDEGKRKTVQVSTLNTIRMHNGSWCVMEDGHDYGDGMPTTLWQWIEDGDSELIID